MRKRHAAPRRSWAALPAAKLCLLQGMFLEVRDDIGIRRIRERAAAIVARDPIYRQRFSQCVHDCKYLSRHFFESGTAYYILTYGIRFIYKSRV